ncbi:Non-specific serine/threonine protein kinase [Bertholletia excelsa]
MILVYEFMPYGSLADQLHQIRGRENYGSDIDVFSLTWERRLNICLGVARGLAYLHAGTRRCFVHRDVKPANVLLDKDWTPKISDFGLAFDRSERDRTTRVVGTLGYMAPEYTMYGEVSDKTDVFAFAVVMLEVLSGRPQREWNSTHVPHWALQAINEGKLDSMIDPSLMGQVSDDCLKCFVQVAIKSLHDNPAERPTMSEVVWNLELALKCQQQGTITEVFSVITPSFDDIRRGWRNCRLTTRRISPVLSPNDTYTPVLSRCSTEFPSSTFLVNRNSESRPPWDVNLKSPFAKSTTQWESQSSRTPSNVHVKFFLGSTTQILDKNMGSRISRDVHLEPSLAECTTDQRANTNSEGESSRDEHREPLSNSTTKQNKFHFLTNESGATRYYFKDGVVTGQNCSSKMHKTCIEGSRSAPIVHLESIANSSAGIMDKNFGSKSSRDVHPKPPFAESVTLKPGKSSGSASDIHTKPLSGSTTQVVNKNLDVGSSRDVCMQPTFVESTTQKEVRSSKSASNVHLEPISNNTTGTVYKDLGSRSSGDVHLKPPSTKSITQREDRSSRTVSDVCMKSLSKSTTHIVNNNIGSKVSRDAHMEPPLVEGTTDQSTIKNFESGSSRDGHCEPLSYSTTRRHTFHFSTDQRGAIRYYFDDGVVIGQDCSSKLYRNCIDHPKRKGDTEDEKKPRGRKKNSFTWFVATNWTTIRPWKAKKHISNLYMTTRSKRPRNVGEMISQGQHSQASVDQDSTEKVPQLTTAVNNDVEVINCSVPSQQHDEMTIFNKSCEDKIDPEKIANGLEASPTNCATIHEKQADIRSEKVENEVELVMTDVVVAKEEESKISHDKILHEKSVSHMFEIESTQGKKSRPTKEKQQIIGDNEKKIGDSTSMGSSSTSLVLDQGDDKGIKVIKNMDGAITLKDQFGVEVKLDFEALTRAKVSIRPVLLRIIELKPHTFIQMGKVSSSFVKLMIEHFSGLLELLDHTLLRESSADAFNEMLHMLEDLKRNMLNVEWLEESVRAMSNHIKLDWTKTDLRLTILKIMEYETYLAELREKKNKLDIELRHLEKQPFLHLDMDGTAAQVLF